MGVVEQLKVLFSPWDKLWSDLSGYGVILLGAIVLLIVGLWAASVIRSIVVRLLKLIRTDVYAEKFGVASILAKGEIKHTLSELLGNVVYWLLVLLVVIITLTAVGLDISGVWEPIVTYSGSVVISIFVLVVGLFLAGFVASLVRTTTANAGIAASKNLGQIAQIVIIVVTILTVLPNLGIRTFIIDTAITIILAATGLGLALAFGLGSKELAGRAMAEFVDKWKKK